ncbi:MAG TPA: hypothetical protein PL003_05350 [Bacteroidales bacterium]|nr:hypothetical protein [Bacteroidales bacterium]
MQTGISEITSNNRYILRTGIKIVLLLLLGSVMVHWINTPLSRFLFYGLVTSYILRSRDYIAGIALVFVFITNPLNLFYSEPFSWFFMITSTVGIDFRLVFVLALLMKLLIIKPSKLFLQRDIFKSTYRVLFVYLGFLFFWSFVFGHSPRSLFFIVNSIPSFFLFLALPRIFSKEQLSLFNGIIFFVNIVHISVSMVDVILAGRISGFLLFGAFNPSAIFEGDEVIRLTGGMTLVFYSLIASIYYIITRTVRFRPMYLWVIVFISALFIINSATRGWMIATGILFLLTLAYYYRQIVSGRIFLTLIFTMGVGYLLLPDNIRSNMASSFVRLSTVESVLEGDMTAGGTASRWDLRGPKVLTRFNESPVFGFGLSKVSADYYDGHVGNHNLLLVGGYTGLIIVWGTVFWIILFFYRFDKRNGRFKGVFIFGIALIAIMIIHSTSRTMVSFYMPVDTAFLIALFFNQVNCCEAELGPSLPEVLASSALQN